jgi:glycerophosphoryl diester phosphodiesterase
MLAVMPARPAEKVAAPAAPALQLMRLERSLVIGHRGYSAFAPENTLPSFRLALAAGVDLVELDYYHSRDGVPVVIHDSTLDRTTDATNRWGGKKLPVTARTAAELATLDAGAWFSAGTAGARLPTLSEALDVIQVEGVTLIERKGGDAAACLQLLRDKKLVNHVIVQSFDWKFLRAFHELESAQILGALGPPSQDAQGRKLRPDERFLNADWIQGARDAGAQVIGWNDLVKAEPIALAHRSGLKVWIYTIDDMAGAGRLLDMGVDGIISNNPAIVWKTLATRRQKETER